MLEHPNLSIFNFQSNFFKILKLYTLEVALFFLALSLTHAYTFKVFYPRTDSFPISWPDKSTVTSIPTFYTFLDDMLAVVPTNGQQAKYLLGPVRLRQVSGAKTCTVYNSDFSSVSSLCFGRYKSPFKSKPVEGTLPSTVTSAWTFLAETNIGKIRGASNVIFPTSGYVYDIPGGVDSDGALTSLSDYDWIDETTRAVTVDMEIISNNLIESHQFLFEFVPEGFVISRYSLYILDVSWISYDYSTDTILTACTFGIFLCWITFLLYQFVSYQIFRYKEHKRQSFLSGESVQPNIWRYTDINLYTILDFISIVLMLGHIVSRLLVVYTYSNTAEFSPSLNRDSTNFSPFGLLAAEMDTAKHYLAYLFPVFYLKGLKYVSFSIKLPEILLFEKILREAMYLLPLSIVLLGGAWLSFYVAFGLDGQYMSLYIFGRTISTSFTDAFATDSFLAGCLLFIYFGLFLSVLGVLIGVTVFLSIENDTQCRKKGGFKWPMPGFFRTYWNRIRGITILTEMPEDIGEIDEQEISLEFLPKAVQERWLLRHAQLAALSKPKDDSNIEEGDAGVDSGEQIPADTSISRKQLQKLLDSEPDIVEVLGGEKKALGVIRKYRLKVEEDQTGKLQSEVLAKLDQDVDEDEDDDLKLMQDMLTDAVNKFQVEWRENLTEILDETRQLGKVLTEVALAIDGVQKAHNQLVIRLRN
jgi:Polycystin cation channel